MVSCRAAWPTAEEAGRRLKGGGRGLEQAGGQAERSGDGLGRGRVGHCRTGCLSGLDAEVRNALWKAGAWRLRRPSFIRSTSWWLGEEQV